MRHIGNGLHHFLKTQIHDFIHQQRKDNRHREGCQECGDTDRNRILQHAPEIKVAEHLPEVFQADPVASPDSPCHLVILEGNDDTSQRQVGKEKN